MSKFDVWEKNPCLEMIERAWWLIEVRGAPSFKTRYHAHYYRGVNYDICYSKKNEMCWLLIWSRFPGEGEAEVYKMGSEGGPGLIQPKSVPDIIKSMRLDMLLDDLASV
jgi:hypothetical protein